MLVDVVGSAVVFVITDVLSSGSSSDESATNAAGAITTTVVPFDRVPDASRHVQSSTAK